MTNGKPIVRTEILIDDLTAIRNEIKTLAVKTEVKDQLDGMAVLFAQVVKGHEEKLEAYRREVDLMFASRDKALALQSAANDVHFTTLNNEAARILKATLVTVSQDTWQAFQKGYEDFKANSQAMLGMMLPAKEFQTFKDATEKAATLSAGKTSGISSVVAFGVGAIGLIGTVLGIVAVWLTLTGKI